MNLTKREMLENVLIEINRSGIHGPGYLYSREELFKDALHLFDTKENAVVRENLA